MALIGLEETFLGLRARRCLACVQGLISVRALTDNGADEPPTETNQQDRRTPEHEGCLGVVFGSDASLILAGSYETEILSRWIPPASTAFILVVTVLSAALYVTTRSQRFSLPSEPVLVQHRLESICATVRGLWESVHRTRPTSTI